MSFGVYLRTIAENKKPLRNKARYAKTIEGGKNISFKKELKFQELPKHQLNRKITEIRLQAKKDKIKNWFFTAISLLVGAYYVISYCLTHNIF